MSYRAGGATNIVEGGTTVDCQKQVRSWRLLRSLLELLIPSCNCSYLEEEEVQEKDNYYFHNYCYSHPTTTIIGTIFGYRRGKVSFCIQTNSKTTTPILLLELSVPTALLAKEMQTGLLRIALECNSDVGYSSRSSTLLSAPVWTMYCNGRKTGFAIKRRPTQADMDVLRLMRSVIVGVGIISGKELNRDDELMYLRANFERVSGASSSESFHLINPDGSSGQDLSIFFLRT
ncbi:hypothetical protein HHK36_009555 [Tetracentron sinense]|uniref:Protein MIZU-KUSSEI 1 n=1 Tax=Tetracentron sinense TaxID=13715 RepID=A0A834ZD02_TETSI|nr:hypothetical protein HHK36_009555 [Tetracentron sinense]